MGVIAHIVAGAALLGAGFALGAWGGVLWLRDQVELELADERQRARRLRVALVQLTGLVVAARAIAKAGGSRAQLDRAGELVERAVREGVAALGGWH